MVADIEGYPSQNEIAFRTVDENNHAPFFKDTGDIRCCNWREFKVGNPLTEHGAQQHVTQVHVPTNYISVSLSPRRLWNIVRGKEAKTPQKIAVIDLRMLKRLGIAYGSTVDNFGFSHYNPHTGDGIAYATRYHHLVLGWLPARSILGFISSSQFEVLLRRSQIDTSLERGKLSDSQIRKGSTNQRLWQKMFRTKSMIRGLILS